MRVGDLTERGGEFGGEILAQLGQFLEGFSRGLGVFVVGRAVVRVDLLEAGRRGGITDGLGQVCGFGLVEVSQTILGFTQVAVVKGIRMHLHEEGQSVEGEVNLGGPGPLEQERPLDPKHQPQDLKDALDPDAGLAPTEPAGLSADELLNGEAEGSGADHGGIAQTQGHDVAGEDGVDLNSEGVARLFDVPQTCRDDHDTQADPEKDKEAAKVSVLAARVEMRDARRVVYCVE